MQYATTIIRELCALGERQLEAERKARKIIEAFLKKQNIPYSVEEYQTYIPKYQSWDLVVDGKPVACEPCGFLSGKITNNYTILSSLISSQKNINDANINFNPLANKISRSNHYFAPALAINRRDVGKVVNAKKILGSIKVKQQAHNSANILVGNSKNPKHVVFSHYDSISTGAVDNASGTALSMEYLVKYPEVMQDTLFALCGNEELSYDAPLYWGHGYRVFEASHKGLLVNAQQIVILDSFGHSKPEKITDLKTVMLGFPLISIESLLPKVNMIAGSLEGLMQFYHADNDVPGNITKENFQLAEKMLSKLLK